MPLDFFFFLMWRNVSFSEVICLLLPLSKLRRGTITQFKPYAVQFEEDYDYIGAYLLFRVALDDTLCSAYSASYFPNA